MKERTDSDRLAFLDSLMSRREYQNARRPSEPVHADLHITEWGIRLYLRDLCARVTVAGEGKSIRETIDDAMAQVDAGKDDAVRRTPRIRAGGAAGG